MITKWRPESVLSKRTLKSVAWLLILPLTAVAVLILRPKSIPTDRERELVNHLVCQIDHWKPADVTIQTYSKKEAKPASKSSSAIIMVYTFAAAIDRRAYFHKPDLTGVVHVSGTVWTKPVAPKTPFDRAIEWITGHARPVSPQETTYVATDLPVYSKVLRKVKEHEATDSPSSLETELKNGLATLADVQHDTRGYGDGMIVLARLQLAQSKLPEAQESLKKAQAAVRTHPELKPEYDQALAKTVKPHQEPIP